MPGPLIVVSTRRVIASDVTRAASPLRRMVGLLGRPSLAEGQALVIEPARQVHTFGLRFPIDVLFVDADWRVVHVVPELRPRRVTKWVARARRVIELPAGGAAEISVGDSLAVSP